jgi:hypothetical protein
MDITRVIVWYQLSDFKVVEETIINHIPIDTLKEVFDTAEDPLVRKPYQIMPDQAQAFNQWVDISFDFDTYFYFVESFPSA